MTNLTSTHRNLSLLAISLLAFVALGAVPLFGGQTMHNVPGTACSAYNNAQANALERSHVRLYNPPTNPNDVWVICPMQRVVEDIQATVNSPYGYITPYFGVQSAPGAEVFCIVRDFDNNTLHFPGAGTSGIVEFLAVTISQPGTLPGAPDAYWEFTTNDTSSQNFWTFTCKLPPGTGINSIDVYQQ